MLVDSVVQRGQPAAAEHVKDLLKRLAMAERFDTVGVAVAYVSVAGFRTVLDILEESGHVFTSYWLFGLDDCLTHPSALDLAASLPNGTLRVAGERIGGRRFHPKVYWLASGARRGSSSLVAGSANLTMNGLTNNVESVLALTSRSRTDISLFRETWDQLWDTGRAPSRHVLDSYRADFEASQLKFVGTSRPAAGILAHDTALLDPSCAQVCWIEVGNITGFQCEQLEIKAEQALFFGLASRGGPDSLVTVSLRSGTSVDIPVKYRGNAMWRFNLPSAIPEVASGLRPGGHRSPFVAVFKRQGPGRISLSFVRTSESSFQTLRRRSEAAGTWGQTTAREYGWH